MFGRFGEELETGAQTILLRHDVDRLSYRALAMARLESRHDVTATYFFRTKPHVFRPRIVAAVSKLGHHIGYHYEDFVDARGNPERAWELFRRNLSTLRLISPVDCIAMHGRPFSRWDGRDLWRHYNYRSEGIACEAYLDPDWQRLHYFTDTGRGWNDGINLRDRPRGANALRSPVFASTSALAAFFEETSASAVILVHPERWSRTRLGWIQAAATDLAVNQAKATVSRLRTGFAR